jgi:hypothetical protein
MEEGNTSHNRGAALNISEFSVSGKSGITSDHISSNPQKKTYMIAQQDDKQTK